MRQRNLTKYSAYYNELRTHRSLDKDAPFHRAIQHLGRIIPRPSSADFITIIATSDFRYRHVRLGGIRKGATLCPGDSGSQDNIADFLFQLLPVIVVWGDTTHRSGGTDESIAICRCVGHCIGELARPHKVLVSANPTRHKS
jgi:hypothetical protein